MSRRPLLRWVDAALQHETRSAGDPGSRPAPVQHACDSPLRSFAFFATLSNVVSLSLSLRCGACFLATLAQTKDLITNATSSVSHDSKVDWLELNSRADLLLFRDRRRRLHL